MRILLRGPSPRLISVPDLCSLFTDTSTILAWLIDEGYAVVAFMADVGQEEDFEAAREKALKCGAEGFILQDMKREFVENLIWPAVQANAIYEVSRARLFAEKR